MLLSPESFANKVLQFYADHGRKDLPWQTNPTAYRVWVSEVMLQQTQVKTVIPYYQKFIQRFNDVDQLASAHIDEVLQHWQGLGYYSRARNLHECAQTVVAQFNGEFPQTLQAMQSLPGIGRSTAGAILSLAMAKPTAILDGNVKRVLSRVFLVDGWYGQSAVAKQLWQLAEQYTPKQATANFNQAMMDLGASLCSRAKPQCQRCPLGDHCLAFIQGKTAEYPHRKPKKAIPTKQQSFALAINDRYQVQLFKRPPAGIWGGLWSLPEVDDIELEQQSEQKLVDQFKHTFTHFHLQLRIIEFSNSTQILENSDQLQENPALAWHNIDQLPQLALPTPMKKFLFKHFQINE